MDKSKSDGDAYATETQTDSLLKRGADYRRKRLASSDMLSTDEAAELVGSSRVSINLWIKKGKCIGLTQIRRGYKLPRWQFEPMIFPVIKLVSDALQTRDGWQLLAFFESAHPALGDLPPRLALERGTNSQRIVELATAHRHQ